MYLYCRHLLRCQRLASTRTKFSLYVRINHWAYLSRSERTKEIALAVTATRRQQLPTNRSTAGFLSANSTALTYNCRATIIRLENMLTKFKRYCGDLDHCFVVLIDFTCGSEKGHSGTTIAGVGQSLSRKVFTRAPSPNCGDSFRAISCFPSSAASAFFWPDKTRLVFAVYLRTQCGRNSTKPWCCSAFWKTFHARTHREVIILPCGE